MRLIDADALQDKMHDECCGECESCKKYIWNGERSLCGLIDSAPTVTPDMAQVLAYESGKSSERPRGEWIGYWTGQEHIVYCSNCKEEYYPEDLYQANGDELPNFCLRCGADMRGGQDNDPN